MTETIIEDKQDVSMLFKALAHPKRMAILEQLQQGEQCVCEIEEALELRQAYVSQQLAVLREAGLVCFRRDGWNVLYRIARPEVLTLLETASQIQSQLGPCATEPTESTSKTSCSECAS